MPNIAKVLKDEISRLARKEVRAVLEKSRKSTAQQQREIVQLKNQLKTLARQVSVLEKGVTRVAAPGSARATVPKSRFVAKGLVSTRKRLGLSAADLAQMLGVTAQTIYNWERGATRPNAGQQARLASLRGVGKRQLQAYVAAQQDQV